MIRLSLLTLAVAVGISGCMLQNLTPTERFSTSSHELNDASRWGRVDIAVAHVSPKYREEFVKTRRNWGSVLQIADHDIVRMQLAEDGTSAQSRVRVSWYRMDTLSLKESYVEQRWERERGNFYLVEEAIAAGDEGLFPAQKGG